MRFKLLFLLLLSSILHAQEEQGYGWDILNSSLNIGGYLDMTYDETRSEKFLFDDIAMILSGQKNRFDILAEIELSHISLKGKSNNSSDLDLSIERLQLSYALSDSQMLRFGKFNSDVGYWNQAPVPILQDTITKPYFIGKLFPRSTTGIMFQQNLNERHLFSLSYQNNRQIAHQDNSIEVSQHSAFSYLGSNEEFSWRFALGQYQESTLEKFRYLGLGSDYDIDAFTLQSELFFQRSSLDGKKPYSGYLQSTWHFDEKRDAVIRFERYDDKSLSVEENIYLLGYVYRPSSNISLKVEYIQHSVLLLNRFVYSLSVLF